MYTLTDKIQAKKPIITEMAAQLHALTDVLKLGGDWVISLDGITMYGAYWHTLRTLTQHVPEDSIRQIIKSRYENGIGVTDIAIPPLIWKEGLWPLNISCKYTEQHKKIVVFSIFPRSPRIFGEKTPGGFKFYPRFRDEAFTFAQKCWNKYLMTPESIGTVVELASLRNKERDTTSMIVLSKKFTNVRELSKANLNDVAIYHTTNIAEVNELWRMMRSGDAENYLQVMSCGYCHTSLETDICGRCSTKFSRRTIYSWSLQRLPEKIIEGITESIRT